MRHVTFEEIAKQLEMSAMSIRRKEKQLGLDKARRPDSGKGLKGTFIASKAQKELTRLGYKVKL